MAFQFAALRPLLGSAAAFLTFGVTLPVWLFLAAGAWLYFDRSSAIRTAVDSAVTELVAGAELEAARATAEANDKLRLAAEARADEARRRARAAEAANAAFAERAAKARLLADNLEDEIDEILSAPVDSDCRVDRGLLERLRNVR